jgi:ElaA protein
MKTITWICQHFSELSAEDMYDILSIRNSVFVVEQNCVYQDADQKDKKAWHLTGKLNESIVAYARILPPGISFSEASIGRVLTHPDYRHNGYGVDLMKMAIKKTSEQFQVSEIRIGAQCYLNTFYTSLGFIADGNEYLEDGIPHIEMIYRK